MSTNVPGSDLFSQHLCSLFTSGRRLHKSHIAVLALFRGSLFPITQGTNPSHLSRGEKGGLLISELSSVYCNIDVSPMKGLSRSQAPQADKGRSWWKYQHLISVIQPDLMRFSFKPDLSAGFVSSSDEGISGHSAYWMWEVSERVFLGIKWEGEKWGKNSLITASGGWLVSAFI